MTMISDAPSTRADRRVYISNRTKAVAQLGRAFADSLDTAALTDLLYAVRDLERQVQDLQEEVRTKIASIAHPMVANRGAVTP